MSDYEPIAIWKALVRTELSVGGWHSRRLIDDKLVFLKGKLVESMAEPASHGDEICVTGHEPATLHLDEVGYTLSEVTVYNPATDLFDIHYKGRVRASSDLVFVLPESHEDLVMVSGGDCPALTGNAFIVGEDGYLVGRRGRKLTARMKSDRYPLLFIDEIEAQHGYPQVVRNGQTYMRGEKCNAGVAAIASSGSSAYGGMARAAVYRPEWIK
jgi:hypothetical protein